MSDMESDRRDEFIRRYFSDWPGGGMPADPADRLRCVRAWLRDAVAPFRASALALMACLQGILEERAPRDDAGAGDDRFFNRIDTEHLCKEPDSILEKMIRKGQGTGETPALSFENFRDQMKDLARFRIVTNFLSDAEVVRDEIAAAYGISPRTDAQKKLRESFVLENNGFEDCTRISPTDRIKGERCFKGIFWPRGNAGLRVEVQIMTVLQEAWDKKDHYLIYEPRRRARPVPLDDEIEMFAMSELLYVADLTFDRLRARITGDEGGGHAPAQ